jgi:hypothetical protein
VRHRRGSVIAVLLLLSAGARVGLAEPYLAVQQGYRCVQCHVNPTGGGMRNDFGLIFAKNLLPAVVYPEWAPNWTGQVFSFLRLGSDLRTSWSSTKLPNQPSQRLSGIEQFRVYADLQLLPDRLGVYVDEHLDPGKPQDVEAYARYGNTSNGWYLKGGRFYLPFGWRLQDNTSFVREVTGISMTTPDEGFELGFERSNWSAQVDVTKGAGNIRARLGDMITSQLVWVQSRWRVGAAASFTRSEFGDRHLLGLFAAARTGPVAWLGEADLVRDSGYPQGTRSLVPLLGELDWAIHRGQNLKLTAEFFDPDLNVAHNEQTRWSLVYELTPFPFVQLRTGWRRYLGIPQSDFQNRSLVFFELHAFL